MGWDEIIFPADNNFPSIGRFGAQTSGESRLEEGKGMNIFPVQFLVTGANVHVLLRPTLHRI